MKNQPEKLNEFLQHLSYKKIGIRRKIVLFKRYVNDLLSLYIFTKEDMLDYATDQHNRNIEPNEDTLKDWINYR
jgi:hypothetical protein